MKFCVSIQYRGGDTYIVEADSLGDAREKAADRFANGEPGDLPTMGYEEIQAVTAHLIDESEVKIIP